MNLKFKQTFVHNLCKFAKNTFMNETNINLLIEIMGWVATILIVGAFALNSFGKINSTSKQYQLANLIGGIFFIINTIHHQAYPSTVVNVVWVVIAIVALLKLRKQ
jgi:Bacterial inner membrane protein